MTINDLREIILSICNYLFDIREIERKETHYAERNKTKRQNAERHNVERDNAKNKIYL